MEVLASICPCPVICGETVMESWQIVCVLERVVFLAHPFLSSMFAMHHLSLSPPPPLPLPPSLPRHFSEGWEQWMDIQVPARRNYGNTALVISGRYMKLCSITQRHNRLFLIVSLSRIQFLSLSTPPPLYLCVHVIVWQPNLSNQQIQPK